MSGDNLRDSIVLEHVKKSFGKHQVLKDINGSIPEGTTVGILGRNGEGKTTLFKIMLDILAADGGMISVLSHAPDGSSRIRTIAGYVPERPAFHSFMTVDDVFKFRTRLFPNWDHPLMNETARSLDLDLSTHHSNLKSKKGHPRNANAPKQNLLLSDHYVINSSFNQACCTCIRSFNQNADGLSGKRVETH
jgi:ABC-type Na+ transport system ATPase subunit NatA